MKFLIFSLLHVFLFSWLITIPGNATPNHTINRIEPVTHSTFKPQTSQKENHDKKSWDSFFPGLKIKSSDLLQMLSH